ncbi:ArsA family ATPase [Brevibacterium linens]|uniref:Arsenite-transporting ATPase n=2 Tax=Brevibacterium linens TaxID=1703 RepID=A0A2H1KFW1_BRELN|nr:ArsA family ATPase [Brevibacterium linens]AZT99504.1 arsenic-transporting ATPase [Brevibacterium linens]KAB1944912.1 ArsA family ATPase [Brevibacterium linens ATCC 9172]SMX97691.1 arsenite-transporting ATPase [Brevibacterium linens ATCC 9172]SMX98661.1 arsenite-transporting ATPase [Brevibacterium linens]
MLLDIARDHRCLFVGGKGGTGKTTVSSGLAMARADDGGRVLLVSTDPAHNLGDIWGQELADEPRRVHTGERGFVDALEVDPEATIDAHFASVERMMTRMLPESTHRAARAHLASARSAPGSHESAVLERIATILAEAADYDLVVVDTAPTGHTLHLLALPERLTDWAETLLSNRDRSERFAAAARHLVSPKEETPTPDAELRQRLQARRDRFAALRRSISDSRQTGFLIVTIAEQLPVAETLGLVTDLGGIGIELSGIVVNRRSPADAGEFLADRRQREDEHVSRLRSAVPTVPLAQLPLTATEPTGVGGITGLAALLAER